MNTIIKLMTLVGMMSVSVAMANDQGGKNPTAAPRVEKRVERQKNRIAHKLEKGKITQEQASKLNQNVDAVQVKEKELAADGKLTKEDRKELHQELNKSGQEIKKTGEKTPVVK